LIIGGDGNLYGTTIVGGTSGTGTVFQVTPKGKETVLYSFTGKATAMVVGNHYRIATGSGREAVTAAIFWLKVRARRVILFRCKWADQASYPHRRERAVYYLGRNWRMPVTQDRPALPCRSMIPQMIRMKLQTMPL
jgi:uncharacterized repeat protein (TIGR03803 family)